MSFTVRWPNNHAKQYNMYTDKPLKLKSSPRTDIAKEEAAALRAQLQVELQNIKQCAYKVYECTQLTLEGYNYCLRHILQDKNAPFKQCAYVYNSNGKRCHLPAPKDKKESGFCNEHALKTHLSSSKRGSRCQPPRTAEALLQSVSHYIKRPRSRTASSGTQYSDEASEDNDSLVTKCLDPFMDVDANNILASGSEILDMCSESESDVDATSYGAVWHDAHADSSDNDSIDSEQEDVLKHTNVYSAEEITLITRDKLIRLQSLYIDQYRYLGYVLKERRRKYLYALKRERENCCSISNQVHDNPKEQRLYKKLKAYNSYHRKHGIEAVCNKRLYERRLKVTEGIAPKPPSFTKCMYTEGGVKCGERSIPVSRYCRKHILEDTNQVLFRACGKMKGDMECTTPVEAIFDDTTCRLHMDIPPIRTYSQSRKDSESDYDDSMETVAFNNSATVTETIPHYPIKIEPSFPSDSMYSDQSMNNLSIEDIKMENPFSDTNHMSLMNVNENITDMEIKINNSSSLMKNESQTNDDTMLIPPEVPSEAMDFINTLVQSEINTTSDEVSVPVKAMTPEIMDSSKESTIYADTNLEADAIPPTKMAPKENCTDDVPTQSETESNKGNTLNSKPDDNGEIPKTDE